MPRVKKVSIPVMVSCAFCDADYDEYPTLKEAPPVITCRKCGVGQKTTFRQPVSYTRGRIYPEGYFD